MAPRGKPRTAGAGVGTRREELLGIAARLFATEGYSQTTVRDIADEAGILSGSLYHHFDSKETMLREILKEFMGDLVRGFSGIVEDQAPPRDTLDELVHYAFATIHKRPHEVALYQNESAVFAKLGGFDFVEKTSRENERLWIGVLGAGRDSGDFRADLEPAVAYRFIRDTVWSSVRWYNPRGKLKHDILADQYLSMLFGGILAA